MALFEPDAGEIDRSFSFVAGVIADEEFSVFKNEARVAGVAFGGEDEDLAEVFLGWVEPEQGGTGAAFGVDASGGEEAAIGEAEEGGSAELLAEVVPGPVGVRGAGGEQDGGLGVEAAAGEDEHGVIGEEGEGGFVGGVGDVEFGDEGLEIAAIRAVVKAGRFTGGEGGVADGVGLVFVPGDAPEPVIGVADGGGFRPLAAIAGEEGEGLMAVGRAGIEGDGGDEHEFAGGGDGEVGVAKVAEIGGEEGGGGPLAAIGAGEDADLAIGGDLVLGGFAEGAEEAVLIANEVGEGVVGAGVPDFGDLGSGLGGEEEGGEEQ